MEQINKKGGKEKTVEKWARIKDMNRQFLETLVAHNYVNICSNSLVIIERKIKTTMR